MAKLRFMSIVAVVFGFLGSLLMFVIGASKSIKAFRIYFFKETVTQTPPAHLDLNDQAMLSIVESIDTFLIALALLVFSFGVYNLFIREIALPSERGHAPWTKINSIAQLKQVLMEVILVVLAVLFLWEVLFQGDDVTWRILVIPLGIVLLALSLKLVEWQSH
jgi:uncharacterized membrane protein YqhA